MSMLAAAVDGYTIYAQQISNVTPEAPPGSEQIMKLVRWLMWFVLLMGITGIIWAGGKFAWERYNGGPLESPKIVIGALVGGIIATSAGTIMNAVILNS
ncbi:hypothetical protein [Skermania piniformis]|uniref:Integral membrane protein n=1 Tax=Skermania pinensis TaxID=39122 RepID=A0ABX8SC15_9ACTN|nr:hypothetical protein [Skermania piniformis]QXQ15423.1 hypothetical protein KV203_09010 [Skermania piniformis]